VGGTHSESTGIPTLLIEFFRSLPQSFKANTVIVHSSTSLPPLLTYLLIRNSLIILRTCLRSIA
jgi:hypothetical protein